MNIEEIKSLFTDFSEDQWRIYGDEIRKNANTDEDKEKAFFCYTKALEINDSFAYVNLGFAYLNGYGTEKNDLKAFECFKNAAEIGFPIAEYQLSNMYFFGIGTEIDTEKAFKRYITAANLGFVEANYYLGNYYYLGVEDFIEKDINKAVEYYEIAANGEDERAEYKLGMAYFNGQGKEKDLEKAFYWLEKSAEKKKKCTLSNGNMLFLWNIF